jgi:hypothetical protein
VQYFPKAASGISNVIQSGLPGMSFSLSVNTNPFVNRYAEPEDLIGTLSDEVGIGHIQLVHEFISPAWQPTTVKRLTDRMAKACAAKRAKITSMMTGPYGRLNHFTHPDSDVRDYYVPGSKAWRISPPIRLPGDHTQYNILTAIMTIRRRNELMKIGLDCWSDVAAHAKSRRTRIRVLGANVGGPREWAYHQGVPGAAGLGEAETAVAICHGGHRSRR